nr:hypothetical protein DVH24_005862 [Ipomoea trifida]
MNATGSVQATAMAPIHVSPAAVENLELEKNSSCVNPPPKFPPAPVRPEMSPNERRDTKGMMPYVAPHAAWAPREKRIMATTATGSVLARPSHMQNTPPRVWTTHSTHSLPLMPNLFAATSDASKRSKKYSVIMLFMQSSTPMEYPYRKKKTHVR